MLLSRVIWRRIRVEARLRRWTWSGSTARVPWLTERRAATRKSGGSKSDSETVADGPRRSRRPVTKCEVIQRGDETVTESQATIAPETPINVEEAVRNRYSAAAQAQEAALCCPVEYDARYLDMIPQEIIDRDYGCGDPSQYVEPGDTVLDLGSGGGKICYIAAQADRDSV